MEQTESQSDPNAESFYMAEGQPASRMYRIYALMWDVLYSAIFVLPTIVSFKLLKWPSYLQGLCVFAVLCLWNVLFVYYKQATPGKARYGLKILTADKKRLHLLQILAREVFGKYVSRILGLGYLLFLLRDDHKSLHDLMSGTNVYRSTGTEPGTKSARDYLVRFACLSVFATTLLATMLYVRSNYPDRISIRSPLIVLISEFTLA
jgi:uncharacterized RDD family membrane protein YckC